LATVGILEAIILGIIQGLTEWLPISSSGHLALAQLALNLEVPVFYDLVLHLGTLAGVFVVYGREISCMLRSVVNQKTTEGPYPQGKRMLWLIILGTIPTAMIGLTFRSFFEYSFHDPLSISIGFIVTGILSPDTKFLKPRKQKAGAGRRNTNRHRARSIDIFKLVKKRRNDCSGNVPRSRKGTAGEVFISAIHSNCRCSSNRCDIGWGARPWAG
jgi:undecaprenyl pyrophosphate phosphatase UppP